ncbi:HNH endonuclease [Luteimonas sp. FXH3W]|uniref:HNH endonuclease n=1 Tax=Aquilutibacter rugosus TaxID=3115820 RepID=A0ABU7V0W3_9GAMM
MSKRKSISQKARFEVFKRDGFSCTYCGATPPKAILHVDHIHPVAEGGDNSQNNLVTACDQCNWGKGARLLTSIPEGLKDKAARIKEAEMQLAGFNEVLRTQKQRIEGDAWEVAQVWMGIHDPDGIPRTHFQSIKKFIEELGVVECVDAMEIAVAKINYSPTKCFKYFCGICWNKIKQGGSPR